MATTTISYHPSATDRAVQLVGAFFEAVKQAFHQPAAVKADVAETQADSDLWKLYRLSRGTDSVSPAVIEKLAHVAAAQ